MSTFNPFHMAQQQFDDTANLLQLSDSTKALLRQPMHEVCVHLPIRMDNGEIKVFEAYRVQYNTARGPAKGGIRWHADETIDTVRALSAWMVWKCALLDLPLGGGKGGIKVDAKTLSHTEQERLARAYMRAIGSHLGDRQDIPAPDIGTTPQIMAWMLDEYETLSGHHEPGVITGKPVTLGGSLGRGDATSRGGIYVAQELAKAYQFDWTGKKVVIHGYGNAGHHAALLATHILKAVVVGIGNSRAALYNEHGIDIAAVDAHYQQHGTLQGFAHATEVDTAALLEMPCDLLIPSAIEGVIHADNADRVQARYVLELANGPTTPEADAILESKGVIVVPDFLANAGGVTVSYFEQVQNAINYYWSEKDVQQRLQQKMSTAFQSVYQLSQEKHISLRKAAFALAVQRVADACHLRGWL
jgi:glutamate dehydrogenase (NAD(P)+)